MFVAAVPVLHRMPSNDRIEEEQEEDVEED